MSESWRQILYRSVKFYAVGGVGIAVQLASLAFFVGYLKWNYLVATALAVETAILHNFVWHELWTWRDRNIYNPTGHLSRLIRFNLTNGAVSLSANVLLMRFFVGTLHIHYFVANIISVASCSLIQFVVSHYYVFRSRNPAGT